MKDNNPKLHTSKLSHSFPTLSWSK